MTILSTPALGINLGGYAYYSTNLPFADFASMSNEWYSRFAKWTPGQDTRTIAKTKNGYPAKLEENQVAHCFVFMGQGGHYPVGQYILTWSGDADVRIKAGRATIVSSEPGKIVYNVATTNSEGLPLEVTRVNPADPVRSISLRQSSGTFRPDYLNDLQRYDVLRFMDWGSTNGHKNGVWANRNKPEDAHWGTALGIPYEVMIGLSNQTNTDCWICVPHLADDDYVLQLASLIKRDLKSELRVWVEYSNEVWNGAFLQARYANDILKPKYGSANYLEAYGKRAAEVFALVSNVLPKERYVRVLGVQGANWGTWLSISKGATVNGVVQGDAIALAPYFSINVDEAYTKYLAGTHSISDETFAEMRASIDKVTNLTKWKEFATAANMQVVAYEGGQHVAARPGDQHNNAGFVKLLIDINRDPRMGDCYKYYLDKWYAASGNSLMTLFNDVYLSNKWGSWGLKEWYDDNDAPKFKAVQEYVQ